MTILYSLSFVTTKSNHLKNNNYFFNCIHRDTGVEIWDSVDPVAMQYVRSCDNQERRDYYIWFNCVDDVHTG